MVGRDHSVAIPMQTTCSIDVIYFFRCHFDVKPIPRLVLLPVMIVLSAHAEQYI